MSREVISYIHLNNTGVPIKEDGESEEQFQARLERFRRADRRVATDLHGKVNFGFGNSFKIGNGVIGLRDWEPKKSSKTDDVFYDPNRPGGWSIAGKKNPGEED